LVEDGESKAGSEQAAMVAPNVATRCKSGTILQGNKMMAKYHLYPLVKQK
jgi:hypothetical protein